MITKKSRPITSRLRRRESQCSIHTKTARESRRLKTIKPSTASSAHGINRGAATLMPVSRPSDQQRPSAVAMSSAPNTSREEIGAIGEWEAQQCRRVHVLGEGGSHHRKELP